MEDTRMELVERYVQAVRYLLPKRQQQDVGRELSEDLRSQVEEKEAELGRPLRDDEMADVLKGYGHPALLALRYHRGRHLIGPDVFPLFAYAVKSVLAVLAVIHIAAPALYFVANGEPAARVVGLFLRFPGVALPVLAWLTIGFAILDTRVVRTAIEGALANWSPRSLAKVEPDARPRRDGAAGLVLTTVLTAWWLAGLAHPPLILGSAARYVTFGPVFDRWFFAIAAAGLAGVAASWLRFAYPLPTRIARAMGAAVHVLGLAVLYLIFRGDVYVVAGEAMAAIPNGQAILDATNAAVRIALGLSLLTSAVALVWKWLRPRAA